LQECEQRLEESLAPVPVVAIRERHDRGYPVVRPKRDDGILAFGVETERAVFVMHRLEPFGSIIDLHDAASVRQCVNP
jgi:hypothetical protein